jgi:hypothetical protein
MQQKAIILDQTTLAQFNTMLSEGWFVLHSCPMPTGGSMSALPTCLVVLQHN